MADISKITLGEAEYNVKDATARDGLASQLVLESTVAPLGQATYSASTDVLLSRRKTYYKQNGETYTALTLGTDYEAREYSGVNGVYERTGSGTRTYQDDLTATFLADRQYSTYRNDLRLFLTLTPVAADPGEYEYVPGVTTFGDKSYEVFLDDPFIYTLSSDTAAAAGKTYCERTGGSGTDLDPYTYQVWNFVVGRPFVLFEQTGYSIQQMTAILNPLITPHQQTA